MSNDEHGAPLAIHLQRGVWGAGLHPDDVGRELRPFPPPLTRFERVILSSMFGDMLYLAIVLLLGGAVYGLTNGLYAFE